jgi:hypothetical protein
MPHEHRNPGGWQAAAIADKDPKPRVRRPGDAHVRGTELAQKHEMQNLIRRLKVRPITPADPEHPLLVRCAPAWLRERVQFLAHAVWLRLNLPAVPAVTAFQMRPATHLDASAERATIRDGAEMDRWPEGIAHRAHGGCPVPCHLRNLLDMEISLMVRAANGTCLPSSLTPPNQRTRRAAVDTPQNLL